MLQVIRDEIADWRKLGWLGAFIFPAWRCPLGRLCVIVDHSVIQLLRD